MITQYIKKVREKDHLKKKEGIILGTVNAITSDQFTPSEQAEMVNRILLGVFDKTKEGRQKHIQEARAYQEGLEKINIK